MAVNIEMQYYNGNYYVTLSPKGDFSNMGGSVSGTQMSNIVQSFTYVGTGDNNDRNIDLAFPMRRYPYIFGIAGGFGAIVRGGGVFAANAYNDIVINVRHNDTNPTYYNYILGTIPSTSYNKENVIEIYMISQGNLPDDYVSWAMFNIANVTYTVYYFQ